MLLQKEILLLLIQIMQKEIKQKSKVNSVKIDNAEDLNVVMPTCHLLEDSKNYRKITGKL